MAVAAHKMAAGPRKEGTLNTCFVRVVDARPRKTMTPQQGFCSNVCMCVFLWFLCLFFLVDLLSQRLMLFAQDSGATP